MFIKNKFLEHVKNLNKENKERTEDKSYESIFKNLILEHKHGDAKSMGLDEYDSEQYSKLTLIPGHIYIFKYMAKTAQEFEYNNIKFKYFDDYPLLLCLKNTKTQVSGINLNFCNYELKTLILNDVYNIDPEFFNETAYDQAHRKLLPLSKNITRFFMNNNNLTLFLNRLTNIYKLKTYSYIYRTYNVQNIKYIRFIEPWQWQYIPFLNYKGSIKTNVLQAIQHITGIDKVKI